MKKLFDCITAGLVGLIVLVFSISVAHATMIDITDPALTHFANFTNDSPSGAISNISNNTPATTYGDFGWHNSPSELPDIAGILLGSGYAVTTLRLQVHRNPFKDFSLQGSNDTTTGLDGSWSDVFSSSVTERRESYWQEWNFVNTNSYSAYRIYATSDYVAGWAMYRWELLADDGGPVVPIPGAVWLLGSGLAGLVVVRRKKRR